MRLLASIVVVTLMTSAIHWINVTSRGFLMRQLLPSQQLDILNRFQDVENVVNPLMPDGNKKITHT